MPLPGQEVGAVYRLIPVGVAVAMHRRTCGAKAGLPKH